MGELGVGRCLWAQPAMMLHNVLPLGSCPVADDGGTRPGVSPALYFLFQPQHRGFPLGKRAFPQLWWGCRSSCLACDGHITVASQSAFLLSTREISRMDLSQWAC